MSVKILVGNAPDVLRTLPEKSVQCCVTSPPYWSLRNYSTESQIWDEVEGCEHEWVDATYVRNNDQTAGPKQRTNTGAIGRDDPVKNAFCAKCNAWRGSLGLEPTPQLYIQHLVQVFDQVRRVLRDDGILWAVIADSYSQSGGWMRENGYDTKQATNTGSIRQEPRKAPPGLKPKDLCLIPERFALAMQEAGWWVRARICWAKKSPMPESVTDRPTSAWEHIWMFTKSARYYYDSEAVKEENASPTRTNYKPGKRAYAEGNTEQCNTDRTRRNDGFQAYADGKECDGRNQRNFWLLGPEPSRLKHYATFPTEIPRRAILASTSERGCCPKCGRGWKRVIEKPDMSQRPTRATTSKTEGASELHQNDNWGSCPRSAGQAYQAWRDDNPNVTIGWHPDCKCGEEPIPCAVLDCFGGAGTTGLAATRLGRDSILIELSPAYAEMARQRILGDAPLLNGVSLDEGDEV